MDYVLGLDVVGQKRAAQNPEYFLYDGHGSVRQVAGSDGAVLPGEHYDYDAYGQMTAGPPHPVTSLRYTGEMWDSNLSMYNLRARWYDPANGRFNQMDPFAGNMQDPQSLHKYLYCHCNPINAIDPSGMFGDFSMGGLLSSMAIGAIIQGAIAGVTNIVAQRVRGGGFNVIELLKEVGLGALIGGISGAAGYVFGLVAKMFLGAFNISRTALYVGVGALSGLTSAFIGQVLTELKSWLIDGRPFVFKDAANRILLASFLGMVTGGILVKIHLWRGWSSDVMLAPMLKGAPNSINPPYIETVTIGWSPKPEPTSIINSMKIETCGAVGGVISEVLVGELAG